MNFLKYLPPLIRTTYSKNAEDSPNAGLLDALNEQLGNAEKTVLEWTVMSYLAHAKGYFLEQWGNWFGIYRRKDEDQDDDAYRQRIVDSLMIKRGTISAITNALKKYLNDEDANIEVYEPYHDIFYLDRDTLDGPKYMAGEYYSYFVIDVKFDRPVPDVIDAIIQAYKPAGVIFYTTLDFRRNPNQIPVPITKLDVDFKDHLYDWFGGDTEVRFDLDLSHQDMIKTDLSHFILDHSNLDGLDVLGGSYTGSHAFWSTMVTTKIPLETINTSDDGHQLMASGTEIDTMDYLQMSSKRSTFSQIPLESQRKNYVYWNFNLLKYFNQNYSGIRDSLDGATDLDRLKTFLGLTDQFSLYLQTRSDGEQQFAPGMTISVYDFKQNKFTEIAKGTLEPLLDTYQVNLHDLQIDPTSTLNESGYLYFQIEVEPSSQRLNLQMHSVELQISTEHLPEVTQGGYLSSDFFGSTAPEPGSLFDYGKMNPGFIDANGVIQIPTTGAYQLYSNEINVDVSQPYSANLTTYKVPNVGDNNKDKVGFAFYDNQHKLVSSYTGTYNEVPGTLNQETVNHTDLYADFNADLFLASSSYDNLLASSQVTNSALNPNTGLTYSEENNTSADVANASLGYSTTPYMTFDATRSLLYKTWGKTDGFYGPQTILCFYDGNKLLLDAETLGQAPMGKSEYFSESYYLSNYAQNNDAGVIPKFFRICSRFMYEGTSRWAMIDFDLTHDDKVNYVYDSEQSLVVNAPTSANLLNVTARLSRDVFYNDDASGFQDTPVSFAFDFTPTSELLAEIADGAKLNVALQNSYTGNNDFSKLTPILDFTNSATDGPLIAVPHLDGTAYLPDLSKMTAGKTYHYATTGTWPFVKSSLLYARIFFGVEASGGTGVISHLQVNKGLELQDWSPMTYLENLIPNDRNVKYVRVSLRSYQDYEFSLKPIKVTAVENTNYLDDIVWHQFGLNYSKGTLYADQLNVDKSAHQPFVLDHSDLDDGGYLVGPTVINPVTGLIPVSSKVTYKLSVRNIHFELYQYDKNQRGIDHTGDLWPNQSPFTFRPNTDTAYIAVMFSSATDLAEFLEDSDPSLLEVSL